MLAMNQQTRRATPLTEWNRAIDLAVARGEAEDAARMAQLILDHVPRHLATYQRLLRITWTLKRWDEGEDWARRLLASRPRQRMGMASPRRRCRTARAARPSACNVAARL